MRRNEKLKAVKYRKSDKKAALKAYIKWISIIIIIANIQTYLTYQSIIIK